MNIKNLYEKHYNNKVILTKLTVTETLMTLMGSLKWMCPFISVRFFIWKH